jgi:triosephosphate isomerase|tara:strand:+ start:1972 stop:2736 length:765 start_codon:yes stop_codon:yes gene_type:complete
MAQNIIAANWKMNNDEYSSKKLTYEFLKLLNRKNDPKTLKVLCVPHPFLLSIDNMCTGTESVFVGAQNCSSFKQGAFTGEVSAVMLKSLGIKYVIIGHSERRELFSETNEELLNKVLLSVERNISPVFCCGEPLIFRNKNNHLEYVINQLKETVLKLNKESFQKVIIAYEPVWAIGSGKTASNEEIEEMHVAIRKTIKQKFGSSVSKNTSILYGGSVNANNAKEIFEINDVNGGLIGGASLQAQEFIDIVNSIS